MTMTSASTLSKELCTYNCGISIVEVGHYYSAWYTNYVTAFPLKISHVGPLHC